MRNRVCRRFCSETSARAASRRRRRFARSPRGAVYPTLTVIPSAAEREGSPSHVRRSSSRRGFRAFAARDDTHREKALCECRTFSFVFVLEENVGIAPILFGDAFAPGAKLRVVVVGAAQSLISPRRRRDDERTRIAHFIGIARAQRGVASAEDVEYFFVHPRLVTKFESDARLARHDGDELA